MTLTIKLDGNWSSFQLANSAPPLSVTDSAIAPSARMHRSWKQTAPEEKQSHQCSGTAWGQWGNIGATLATLGPHWGNIGATLGPYWGNIGPHWGNIGATLGQHWGNIGAPLGQHWGNVGATLDHIKATLGPHWGNIEGQHWSQQKWMLSLLGATSVFGFPSGIIR